MKVDADMLAKATLSRQSFRCASCDRPFQHTVALNLPVEMVVNRMYALKCPICDSKNLNLGEGRSLSEDRAMRPYQNGSPEFRAGIWLTEGETGESSKTIAFFMLNLRAGNATPAAPSDLDDFRRCLLLLDRIPEWRPRMIIMAELAVFTPAWGPLAQQWHALEAAFLEEAPELTSAAPNTSKLFKRAIGQ